MYSFSASSFDLLAYQGTLLLALSKIDFSNSLKTIYNAYFVSEYKFEDMSRNTYLCTLNLFSMYYKTK